MISPSPNTVLAGSSVTFGWSANGAPVSEWWLYVGSTVGSRDYADTGSLGAELYRTVTGLPRDASAVFVRLRLQVSPVPGRMSAKDTPRPAAPAMLDARLGSGVRCPVRR